MFYLRLQNNYCIMKKTFLLPLFFILFFSSCNSSIDDIKMKKSTIAQELDSTKSFYAANGGTFKFRVNAYPPIEGYNNNTFHAAEVFEIIDNQGIYSVFYRIFIPSIDVVSYSAILNCRGD